VSLLLISSITFYSFSLFVNLLVAMTALPLQLHISDCHALGPNIGLLKTHRIELQKEVETRIAATVISHSILGVRK
jgi:hypothetical protein